MADMLNDDDWDELLETIRDEECTPFLGAGACAGILPTGSQLATDWATEYKYPLKEEKKDLARVAQFLAVTRGPIRPRKDIQKRFKDAAPPDFSRPDEPHALLADLNLPIYITTNYDSFMTLALKSRRRDPKRELCRWNQFVEQDDESVFSDENKIDEYKPTPANPLVYHLHGHYDFPQSLVLTEDDYLNFLVNLSSNKDFLPAPIRSALASTSLLFVGYSLADWNFRVLFRGLVGSLGSSLGYPSVAVQLTPDTVDNIEDAQDRAQTYLNKYFEEINQIKVRVYWGDIKKFTTELRQRWEKSS